MTNLEKPVTRRCLHISPAIRRRLVVTLMPGDRLAIREEGRRQQEIIDLDVLYVQMVKARVETERR